MSLISKIKIDMVQRGNVPVVYAVQGEGNTRVISATLYKNGEPFLSGGESVSLAFRKPDGTSGWYDTLATGDSAFYIEENNVTVTIAEEVLTVAGDVVAAIRFDDPEGPGRSTTFPFLISVSPDPAIDSPKSENYYKVQTWDEVNTAIAELYDMVDSGGGGGGGTPGTDGTTFFPSVSASGVISWTNDGGKENPAPVDLRAAVIASLPVYNGEVEQV